MLHKIRWFMILSLTVVSVIALAACGSSPATPAPTVAPPTSVPTEAATVTATAAVAATSTPPAATVAAGAAEQQVAAGQKVYTTDCESCHGADLQGVTGPSLTQSIVSEYGNAKQVADFTSQLMPQNAPGSLSQEQYYDVTAFIPNKDGLLPAGETLTPENASKIKLTPAS